MAARQGAMGVEELIRRKVATLRYWKKTKLYKRHPKWDFQFSVMTYNILSQNALENHIFLYRNCNPAFLMEDYRISRILPEILQSQSDIICLQEVEQHVFVNRMQKIFYSNGFESIFKKRTGCKSDGCAILWRRNKFDFVRESDVEYHAKDSKLLNRDNVGLIAVLKPVHPRMRNMLLHIATTHLLFNPRRGDIKLCQLRYLFAELERMSLREIRDDTRHYHPVILCGDFNIEPHSPLYEFIEKGSIDVRNTPAGDLSGQSLGKAKGNRVDGENLSLHQFGISNASRYEKCAQSEPKIPTSGDDNCKESNQTSTEQFTNESKLEPYSVSDEANAKGSRWVNSLIEMGNQHLNNQSTVQESKDGDNSQKVEGMEVARTRDFDLEAKQHFSHDFSFVPAYKYQKTSPKDMPISSMAGNDPNTVDHIFYNVKKKTDLTAYTEGALRLLSVYTLMYAEEVRELGGLPNACLCSDHISLIAKFALCNHR